MGLSGVWDPQFVRKKSHVLLTDIHCSFCLSTTLSPSSPSLRAKYPCSIHANRVQTRQLRQLETFICSNASSLSFCSAFHNTPFPTEVHPLLYNFHLLQHVETSNQEHALTNLIFISSTCLYELQQPI